jgi:hypothetical protein
MISLLAAMAMAMVVVVGSLPARSAPKEPVELPARVYVGGRAKLAVKKAFSLRPNVSWRVELGDGTFAVHGLTDEAVSGTFERKGSTGRTLVLAFDDLGLTGLADGFLKIAVDHGILDEDEEETLAITKLKASIVIGKKPEKTKLKMKVTLENGAGARGLFKVGGKVVSRRVVVLDDGRSAPQVMEALRRQRIAAFNAGFYQTWDGISPPLDETDVVLFLQGYEYNDTMTPAADQALVDFVNAGGLLVRTEWCAYEYGDGSGNLMVDAFLPVRAPESDYLEGERASWTIQDRRHPLTKGLKPVFHIDGAGFSFIEATPGATVLATNQRDEPTLALGTFGPGEVVHVNHDLTYEVAIIPKEILRVLTNCASYGVRR